MVLPSWIYPHIEPPVFPPRCAYSVTCSSPAIDQVAGQHYCTWHAPLVLVAS
ncbi:MAG: hypothetical protein ACYCU5_14250 [Actinomycetes bacterium]